MATETVEAMVAGGKASAAPPLGPALGPLGVNIGQVIIEINKKTESFAGMQVPIKVVVDKDTKEFSISVGTPPASALIKKEAGIEKGAGNPKLDKVADLAIEQIIKISKMKEDNLLGKDNFARVKEIIGSCDSMGVLVEGKQAREVIKEINEGKYKKEIESGKTELTVEEKKALEAEKKRLQEEIEKRKVEFEAKGKSIVDGMQGKTRSEIKAALIEAGIPTLMIESLLPADTAAAAGAGGTAPAPGAKTAPAPGAKAPPPKK